MASFLEQAELLLFIADRNPIASILCGMDREYLPARNGKTGQRIAGGLPGMVY